MINLLYFPLAADNPDLADNIGNAVDIIENTDPNILLERTKALLWDFVPRVLGVLLLLALSHVFIKAFVKLIKKFLVRSKINPTLHSFILGVVKNSVWVFVIIVCLLILKVPTSPLVTVMGSVGLALSLALKDSLANVAGGISVLFNHPFAKGDLIEIKGIVGTVRAIDLVYTRIITDDDKTVYLPNGDISKSVVINYSSEPLKRLDLIFFIPVESDFEKAKEIILSVLTSSAYTLTQPEPIIRISGRNSDSYSVSCKVWTKAEHYDTISAPLHDGIDLKLKQAGM